VFSSQFSESVLVSVGFSFYFAAVRGARENLEKCPLTQAIFAVLHFGAGCRAIAKMA